MKFNLENIKIRYIGDPLLRKKSASIIDINNNIRELAKKMIDIMYKKDGIGLAAPQIGINYDITVIDSRNLNNSSFSSPGEALLIPQMPIVLINPKILKYSDDKDIKEEGCLSVPGVYAKVIRPNSITLKAKLINGEEIETECSNFLSRVLQHEIDHLNGILFVDRLTKMEYRKIKSKINKIKNM